MIVTISREYGAGSLAVGEAVARALSYRLVTDEVPPEVAATVGLAPEEIDARAESRPPLAERLLGELGAIAPELGFIDPGGSIGDIDAHVRLEIERNLCARAAEGNVVIIGRLGSEVLAGVPGLMRIFLRGDPAWRAARLVEYLGLTQGQAESERDRVDAERRHAAWERFHLAFGDPRRYEMVLDVSTLGTAGAACAIVAAAGALAPART